MIKGVNRSVIVVSPPKKSSFEKIFFVMKVRRRAGGEVDMLTEANKIIRDSLATGIGRSPSRRSLGKWAALTLAFAIGVAAGVLIGAFAAALIA